MTDLPQRFWDKVERITESGCWIWMGAVRTTSYGMEYGRFNFEGKNRYAHRVSYQCLVGPAPEGLHLDHLCRVTCCVNPDHLEPVTNAENVLRGWKARGRKTHCVNGHFLDGVNIWRSGTQCIQCARIRESSTEFKAAKNAKARAKWAAGQTKRQQCSI